MTERDLDLILHLDESIERAIPGAESTMIDLYSTLALPVRHEASAQTVAYKIGFQPTCEAVFARRPNQPIGQQHEGAIGVGRSFLGARQELVEELPQAELVEESANHQHGPPSQCINHFDGIRIFPFRCRRAEQDLLKLGAWRSHILAAEIRDHPLLDLAVFAIGFDDADIFVDSALGGRDFDRADVHGDSIRLATLKARANSRKMEN